MMDGVLAVSAPPSCVVTLVDAAAADGDDDDGSDGEVGPGRGGGVNTINKGKYQRKLAERKKKAQHLSSGINWSVSKRAFGIECDDGTGAALSGDGNEFVLGENALCEDDIVVLPQYECQIVSVLSGCPVPKKAAGKAPSMGGSSVGAGGGLLKRKAPLTSKPLLVRKRPLAPLQSRRPPPGGAGGKIAARPCGGAAARPGGIVSRPAGARPGGVGVGRPGAPGVSRPRGPPGGRVPPPQPGGGAGVGGGGGSAALARRIPPPQPERDGGSGSGGSDDEDDNEDDAAPPPKRPAPLSSSLLSGKRRRVVRRGGGGGGPGASSSSADNDDDFPGAIGTVVVPHSVRGRLKPHQRVGVAFLWNCLTGSCPRLRKAAEGAGLGGEDVPRGAVLADEMGLGKTLMTVATIFALHRRQRDHRFIVVCPSSLVSNWAKEFDKWIGRASNPKRVVVRRGGEEGKRAIKSFVPVKPNQSEVLILSYELFRMNAPTLSNATHIGLLVVDEGHRLKNSSGSRTLTALNSLASCESRLLITGTPIQNNLSEFYNVANFVCPGLLGDLPTFRRVYERPLSAANTRSATPSQRAAGRALSKALDDVTSAFMLRRLQRDVLRDELPPRTEVLVFCSPSAEQREAYGRMTEGASARVCGVGGAGMSSDALTLLTGLRKLCSHPHLMRDADGGGEGRGAVGRPGDLSSGGGGDAVALSGKLSALDSLLSAVRSEAPADKVVVVSNFTSALSLIEDTVVKRRGWGSMRLDGSTEQGRRQGLVDSFNRGSPDRCFVFLLSSRAGGCGLNLVGANRLVMFDPDWNPATDMQAMARVYRQGQTKPSFIYRLFTSGTVEEVIYQRQTQKSNLAALTVDGGGGSAGFTAEELRDCFTLKDVPCDTKLKVGKRWDDYDGPDSLRSGGCSDSPLLTVAEERDDVVGFVRIVGEAERSHGGVVDGVVAPDEGGSYDGAGGREAEFEEEEAEFNDDDEEEAEFTGDDEEEFDEGILEDEEEGESSEEEEFEG